MGFRNFPSPKGTGSGKPGSKCQRQGCSGTLVSWDCGCAWGCSLCSVTAECSSCHAKHGGSSGPKHVSKPKQKCPVCGAMKRGMEQHIAAKHGGNATPPLIEVTTLTCPDCGSKPMRLQTGHYGPFYGCPNYPSCRGAHGAHPNGMPKGKPADAETRKYRIAAHSAFDPLWKGEGSVFPSRGRAYMWMQNVMGLSVDQAHIGNFDSVQCILLINHILDCFGEEAAV